MLTLCTHDIMIFGGEYGRGGESGGELGGGDEWHVGFRKFLLEMISRTERENNKMGIPVCNF